jgi:RNA polymerase sigma factor (TIGR02999 family)
LPQRPEHEQAGVAELLAAWSAGDESALDQLIPLVYEQLKQIAGIQRRRVSYGDTAPTTALVNELYLRLASGAQWSAANRAHFFAAVAKALRHIVIDRARRRHAGKRPDPDRLVTWTEGLVAQTPAQEMLALDAALDELARLDERKARIVEMRYFAGMSAMETADALDVSTETIRRELRLAEAWLHSTLSGRSDTDR